MKGNKKSQPTAGTVMLAKSVTCVTNTVYNITQGEEKIKWSTSIAR